MFAIRPNLGVFVVALFCLNCCFLEVARISAQEPHDFHWTLVNNNPEQQGTCFFRKKMTLVGPEQSQILIAATGDYALYVNGKLVTKGSPTNVYQTIDTTPYVYPGVNLVAIEVHAQKATGNGLAVRFRVKEKAEVRWRGMAIDQSWLTNQLLQEEWNEPRFRDLSWLPATPARDLSFAPALPVIIQLNGGLPLEPSAALPGDATEQIGESASVKSSQRQVIPIANSQSRTTPIVVQPTTDTPAGPLPNQPVNSVSINDSSIETQSTVSPEAPSTPPQDGASTIGVQDGASTIGVPQASDQAIPIQQSGSASSPKAMLAPGPADDSSESEPKFVLSSEFRIDPVLAGKESGSIIAMAFDEFGYLIFSQEGGSLKIADLSQEFGKPRVTDLCDDVKNCQGLVPINGKLYVTGDGPDGLGLYRLDRTSPEAIQMRVAKTLVKFKGEVSEHGPHGLTLGPDGMLYCVVGNGSGAIVGKPSGTYQHPYEIDLTTRYEDPSGHSNGVKAPAGTVIRLSLDGARVETVAGGLRNAYDLVFNAHDDLFVHDSDMESDFGLPWYRPTALYHVTEGIDAGWRSGWAKFPYYYLDTVPPVATTGRGSPAGGVCYTHIHFPTRYQGALFLADWSEGRILAVRQTVSGASYQTEVEEFLKGKPMNVTDLDVGEDGSLYFCTGGRGTSGGVYRVAWKGKTPDQVTRYENDLARLVRHPQPTSPWARQSLAVLFQRSPDELTNALIATATNTENSANVRCAALENLFLFGKLDESTLTKLVKDPSEQVRAKVCFLSGTRKSWGKIGLSLVGDESKFVSRRALEACLKTGTDVPVNSLLPLLGDLDPALAASACRVLERLPLNTWKSTILASSDVRQFCVGALALNRVAPSVENSNDILVRCSEFMDGFINDRDFMDLLRVVQLSLARGEVEPEKIQAFSEKISQEFPTTSPLLNRELIRILTYLKSTKELPRYVEYLQNHTDDRETKILVAMNLATMSERIDDATRVAVIDYLHQAAEANQGGSYQLYLARCIRKSAESLSDAACEQVLAKGEQWPYALVPIFYRLSKKDLGSQAQLLCDLDRRLIPLKSKDVVAQARLGIIALLAQGKTDIGTQYLRDLWSSEPDRRDDIIIGIAENPSKENWTYLIASLPIVDDLTATDVLNSLQAMKLRPVASQHYRELLELGYRLRNDKALQVSQLLAMWTKQSVAAESTDWKAQLDAWSDWYSTKWPEDAPVNRQETSKTFQINFQKNVSLLDVLEKGSMKGDAERGMQVFQKANCAKCHRFGMTGSSSGPDLTTLGSRFSKRETLEAMVEPSKVVPDQYRSTQILNDKGVTFVGLKVDNGDGSTTLILSSGERVRFTSEEIVDQKLVGESSMPSGLLDHLSKQEILDLFAFLYNEGSSVAGTVAPMYK